MNHRKMSPGAIILYVDCSYLFFISFIMGLFSGLVQLATLPVSIVQDVATLWIRKVTDGETFSEKQARKIDDAFRE